MRPLALVLLLVAAPASAAVCTDQGIITSLQAAGEGANALQLTLDNRATYVGPAALPPGALAGLAAMAAAAHLARQPVLVGYERTGGTDVLAFIEMPPRPVPSARGCAPRGLALPR